MCCLKMNIITSETASVLLSIASEAILVDTELTKTPTPFKKKAISM